MDRALVITSPKQRVGHAYLGDVMLALLKYYGITDQEISDALADLAP